MEEIAKISVHHGPSRGITTHTATLFVLPLLIANIPVAVLPACGISCGYVRTGLTAWHPDVLVNCCRLTGFKYHIAWTFAVYR